MQKHHKPRTRILSLALTAMMLLSLLPMSVFATDPAATATKRTDILDLTTISPSTPMGATYDPATSTYTHSSENWVYNVTNQELYLSGVDFEASGGPAIVLPPNTKLIVKKGTANTLKTSASNGRAIYMKGGSASEGNLTIQSSEQGSGRAVLTAEAPAAAISSKNDASDFKLKTILNDVDLSLKGDDLGAYHGNQFEMNAGSIYATGEKAFEMVGDAASITIDSKMTILGSEDEGATADNLTAAAVGVDGKSIKMGKNGNGNDAKTVMIEKVPQYLYFDSGKLYLCTDEDQVQVKPGEISGWSGSGKTLTLTNFTYETDAYIGLYMAAGTTLNFVGTNNITSADMYDPSGAKGLYGSTAIYCDGNLTISGADDVAVLNATAGDVVYGTTTANGNDAESIGIQVEGKLTVSGGNLNATGGTVTTGSGGFAYSGGIYVEKYNQTAGKVTATAADMSDGTNDGNSVGLDISETFALTDGELVAVGAISGFSSWVNVTFNNLTVVGTINSKTPGTTKLKLVYFMPDTYYFVDDNNNSTNFADSDVAKYVKITKAGGGGGEVVTPNLSGQVTDHTGAPVANITVKLMQGAETKYETTTDASGNYKFTDVKEGRYNVVAVRDDGTTITEGTRVTSQITTTANLTFWQPGSQTFVNGGLGCMVVHLNTMLNNANLPAILTDAEADAVNAGGRVSLVFTGKDKTSLSSEDSRIEASAPGKVFQYMDLSIMKTVYNSAGEVVGKESNLTTLPQMIGVEVPLPAEMLDKKGFVVYRIHDGKAEELKDAANANGGEFASVFEAQENGVTKLYLRLTVKNFSTYAVGYDGTGTGGNGGNGGNGYYTGTGNGTWNPGTGNLPQPGDRLPSFTDVTKTDWYYDAVMTAVAKGWFTGTSETTFGPNETTTRGMIATILHRMAGSPIVTAPKFGDVALDTWYTSGIAWAQNNGIVTGYGNNKYGPNDNITREQLASILYRYAQLKGFDTSKTASLENFADAGRVSTYAKDAMGWALGTGLISGRDGQSLAPGAYATRAEVATVLVRLLQMYGM